MSSIMQLELTLEEESTTFDTQIPCCTPLGIPAQSNYSSANKVSPSRKPILMDYATPAAEVSAFCRSVLSTLIPNRFWGEADTQTHNKGLFLKAVDKFISLRRFETMSLHDALQGMKVRTISSRDDLITVYRQLKS